MALGGLLSAPGPSGANACRQGASGRTGGRWGGLPRPPGGEARPAGEKGVGGDWYLFPRSPQDHLKPGLESKSTSREVLKKNHTHTYYSFIFLSLCQRKFISAGRCAEQDAWLRSAGPLLQALQKRSNPARRSATGDNPCAHNRTSLLAVTQCLHFPFQVSF